jgi:hypothetical protein
MTVTFHTFARRIILTASEQLTVSGNEHGARLPASLSVALFGHGFVRPCFPARCMLWQAHECYTALSTGRTTKLQEYCPHVSSFWDHTA